MAEKNKCKAKTPRGKGKQGIYEGTYILQEYLKKKTDIHNKKSLEDIVKDNENIDVGDVLALKNKLADLTKASYHINTNVPSSRAKYNEIDDEILHNARVIFEDTDYVIYGEKLRMVKGKETLIEATDFGTDKRRFPKGTKFDGIYYNHLFSYEELDNIIDSIQQNKTLTSAEADRLIDKLKAELASDEYAKRVNVKINKFYEPAVIDKGITKVSLGIIDEAIKAGKKISANFYAYDLNKEADITNYQKHILNPYYIVAHGNHFYLVAALQRENGKPMNMSFWRVDLLRDIVMLNEKVADKEKVQGLPKEWDENWILEHLNMSYDKPQIARIRVAMYNGNTKYNCAYILDAFGRNFKVEDIKEGHKDYKPYHKVIRVKCSPFGLRNWALQYSDRVEILPPVSKGDYDVRADVIKQLKMLNEKYGVK